jgi:hypothetical protein
MTPKLIESLKNRKKLPILGLKQSEGWSKSQFFFINIFNVMTLKVLCHGTKYPLMHPHPPFLQTNIDSAMA